MDSETTNVEVHFVSKTESVEVPQGYFAVPVSVARYGLSEIVNKLTELDPPRPFDFLIDGHFLRSDIATYLSQRAGADQAEKGLTLEVVEAMAAPDSEDGQPHPDWVSGVATTADNVVLTCCYDGTVRVFQPTKGKAQVTQATCVGSGHTGAAKAVCAVGTDMFASAAMDRTVRLWQYDGANCRTRAVLEGHTEAVGALVSRGHMLATSGWDNALQLWNTQDVIDGPAENDDEGNPKKKKKTATGAEPIAHARVPASILEGHSQAVTALVWPHSSAIYSASWDYSIRQWDPTTGANVSTWRGNKAISGLSFSLEANVLASAHEDNAVRIWDPRAAEAEVVKLTLKSHKAWVTGVGFCPTQPHLLASCSRDKTVKMWDTRSSVPLHTLSAHSDKVLCLSWMQDGKGLVSGGADCHIKSHIVK